MEYIWETCFSSYARPGLEWKERSLMNIAMLIALGRGPELRIHLRAAVSNGLTEEQICEACRHAMIYCGVPAGRDAMVIASAVFAQLKESGEYPNPRTGQTGGGGQAPSEGSHPTS
jgi:4-carboxymuconolactone decarboxylase